MMRYQAIITKDGTVTLAHFPDCPGCQTQADRGEDILSLAQDALEGWLEAHLVHGRVPPRPSVNKRHVPPSAHSAEIPVSPGLAIRLQLRWARHDAGLSQAELADKVGVTQQQIAALESPDSNVTLNTLLRIAKVFEQDVEVLFSKRGQSSRRRARQTA